MYQYDYPRPALTVDVCIFREAGFNDYDVLLIKRTGEPCLGMYALPGGYVEIGKETAIDAAYREMTEEVSPSNIKRGNLKFVGYYDALNRHPTDIVVNVAFATIVDKHTTFSPANEIKELEWFSVYNLPELAFDHKQIIMDAHKCIARQCYT